MSALGNLIHINRVIVEHTHRGLYNYDMGKNAVKNKDMTDYESRAFALDCLSEINVAIDALGKLGNNSVIDMAVTNLEEKAKKLRKKIYNSQANTEVKPKLEGILQNTQFDNIEAKEAEELIEQVIQMTRYNVTSKTTKLTLEIFSKLGKHAPKEVNNNNAPAKIENPKEEEQEEILFNIPAIPIEEELFEAETDTLEDNFHVEPFVFIPTPSESSITKQLNKILKDLVPENNAEKMSPEEFAKRLQVFSFDIDELGKSLAKDGMMNIEHVLHGQIYEFYKAKGYQTEDVNGVPFARHALQNGIVTLEDLSTCFKNTMTLMYLDMLHKCISDKTATESELNNFISLVVGELEKHHDKAAWTVFGETSNFGTAEEKKGVQGDFGRNGFVSDKVSRDTKLKAILKTIEICKGEIKKQYEN